MYVNRVFVKIMESQNLLNNIYINKLEFNSNFFVIKDEEIYEELCNQIRSISDENINFRLYKKNIKDYYIYLSFNPQFCYNKNKYNYTNVVDYKKILKCTAEIQERLNLIDSESLKIFILPISRWILYSIEISKDIKLKNSYFDYIDTLKAITSSRCNCYSLLADYDNGRNIYFHSLLRDNSISPTTHIRFENKIKIAKAYKKEDKDFQERKENILQCTLMLKGHRANKSFQGELRHKVAFPMFYYYFMQDGLFQTEFIEFNNLIENYEDEFKRCNYYFDTVLAKYLFHEDLELHEELKDDVKLLSNIIKTTNGSNQIHILYFIVIKLLSELKDYNLAKLSNFLSSYPKSNIKKLRKEIFNSIVKYRNTYRKNFKSYSTEDLYLEIRTNLLLE